VAEFRRASAGDAAAIRDLTRAAYSKWIPVIGREPMPMTADYDAAVWEHLIDLLSENGALVGLIEMNAEPDHLLIVNVAVAPAMQGRGLGHILMAHAEDVAGKLGFSELRLFTHHRYEQNIALYTRLGYLEDHREPIADGFKVHMSKRI
jgi:ribosomal protein S18 acetylase RimI-like enzyme